MADNLFFYNDDTFNGSSQVDPPSFFSGNGSETEFDVISGLRAGTVLQYSAIQKFRYTGGFTVDTVANTVTINAAPALGAQGIVPGQIGFVLDAYDQAAVDGITNPLIKEKRAFLANITDPHLYEYLAKDGEIGLELSILDAISSAGCDISWLQLASSAPITGIALTYAATGVSLFLPELDGFGVLAASTAIGASSVSLSYAASGGTWWPGEYVLINPGQSNAEVRRIATVTVNNSVLTFETAFDYTHAVDEPVYACGWDFWIKLTVPINVSLGQAQNFLDDFIRCICDRLQRT